MISLPPEKPKEKVNHIVVLCSDCKEVPISAHPDIGDAKLWDGILICTGCAQKWIDRQQAKTQVLSTP